MIFKKVLPVLAAGAIMIAAVFGVTTYQNVSASAASAPAAIVQQSATFTDLARGKGPGMPGGDTSDQALATALGIDLTKLQAAYKTATAEALKQAVAAGLITQAQADQITANGDGHFRGLPMVDSSKIDYEALLAKALGIDTAKLQAARTQAFNTSIDAAVTAGNMTQAQADLEKGMHALQGSAKFQASQKAAFEAGVKQAVSDGVITQAQADAILAAQANPIGRGAGFGGPGLKGPGLDGQAPAGRGGSGGRGGRDGGQGTPNTAPNATPAPSTTK